MDNYICTFGTAWTERNPFKFYQIGVTGGERGSVGGGSEGGVINRIAIVMFTGIIINVHNIKAYTDDRKSFKKVV